jgi:hypothetical protein
MQYLDEITRLRICGFYQRDNEISTGISEAVLDISA